jgi:propionate catabolism operon transcriptional regulator
VGDLGVEHLRSLIPEIFAGRREAGRHRAAVPLLRSVSRAGEIDHILKTLEECGGNRTEACKRLGIGRTTLWRKLNGKA